MRQVLRLLLHCLALTLPTFIALLFVTFVAIRRVPADPVALRVGERGISAERLAMFRHDLGLDQPVWKPFADWVWHLLHGDFGTSLATLLRAGHRLRGDPRLAVRTGAVKDALHHPVLPAILLGTTALAVIARMTRSAVLDVLGAVCVRTARAKGLPAWQVIFLHALFNALTPVVTIIGLQVGALMAGAVLTETILFWPGVGKRLIESIPRRDYPALQGGVMPVPSPMIAIDLLLDLGCGLVNPRIRRG